MKILKRSITILVCLILFASCSNKENQYLVVEGKNEERNFTKVTVDFYGGELGTTVKKYYYKGNLFTGVFRWEEVVNKSYVSNLIKTGSITPYSNLVFSDYHDKGIVTKQTIHWNTSTIAEKNQQLILEIKFNNEEDPNESNITYVDEEHFHMFKSEKQQKKSNSYSNTNTQQRNYSEQKNYNDTSKPCSECHKKQRFQTWTGYGWKWIEETKIGSVKCSGCPSYGYTESLNSDGRTTRKKNCYVSYCNNGWVKCSKCFGKGVAQY